MSFDVKTNQGVTHRDKDSGFEETYKKTMKSYSNLTYNWILGVVSALQGSY